MNMLCARDMDWGQSLFQVDVIGFIQNDRKEKIRTSNKCKYSLDSGVITFSFPYE
jgi:hypothetical protein